MLGGSACSGCEDVLSPPVRERGSLRTSGDGRSQFIGSASGIYFVITVRQAFANANVRLSSFLQDQDKPSPEDRLVADEDEVDQEGHYSTGLATLPCGKSPWPDSITHGARILPQSSIAKQLFMTYFQTWHKFFPFLHGPTISRDIALLYPTTGEEPSYTAVRQSTLRGLASPLARIIILQCVFNLASLHGGVELPATPKIDPTRVLSVLLGLAAKADIASIQAVFEVQLLLVARMSFRTAMIVAGLISSTTFLAGLHRCPVRYGELSANCDIRKRLFWSIYVLDRFFSQALGYPLGIQDSDLDVCSLNSPELHSPHYLPPTYQTTITRYRFRLTITHMRTCRIHKKTGRPMDRINRA